VNEDSVCNTITTDTLKYSFDNISSFTFIERIDHSRFHDVSVGGHVKVLPASEEQTEPIVAEISLSLNQTTPEDFPALEACKTGSEVTISVDEDKDEARRFGRRSQRDYWPRIDINVNIYATKDLKLDDLSLISTVLRFTLASDLDLTVANLTYIESKAASVHASNSTSLLSRKTIISLDAGSVTGAFNLQELFAVNTKVGSVHLDITPQDTLPSGNKTAQFFASSNAGRIWTTFPVFEKLPDRDYQVDVSTKGGTIGGSYVHGSKTVLTTEAGAIAADIVPFDASEKDSTFVTSSRTGVTSINVFPSYKNPEKSLSHIKSSHHTVVGDLTLKYPSTWEGRIHGSVIIGRIVVRGSGVRVIRENGLVKSLWDRTKSLFDSIWSVGSKRLAARALSGFGHSIEAERGNGDSDIEFKSNVGSVAVIFGEEEESDW